MNKPTIVPWKQEELTALAGSQLVKNVINNMDIDNPQITDYVDMAFISKMEKMTSGLQVFISLPDFAAKRKPKHGNKMVMVPLHDLPRAYEAYKNMPFEDMPSFRFWPTTFTNFYDWVEYYLQVAKKVSEQIPNEVAA